MKGISRSKLNYSKGYRPRRFFNKKRIMINLKTMTGDGGLQYDPNWNRVKIA